MTFTLCMMQKESKIEKDLECVVCNKMFRELALPKETETICMDCLPTYDKAVGDYVKYLDEQEAKEKAMENTA